MTGRIDNASMTIVGNYNGIKFPNWNSSCVCVNTDEVFSLLRVNLQSVKLTDMHVHKGSSGQ